MREIIHKYNFYVEFYSESSKLMNENKRNLHFL